MKKFIFSIICALLPILASAQEPYAELSESNTVLTFYYNDQKASRGGMDVGPFTNSEQRGWNNYAQNISSVVFDASFASCTTITSTSYWFQSFSALTTIIDLKNLKTDNVEDMSCMFDACSNLTSLDVSGFNTSKVTSMWGMFSGCSSLTSIDVSGFNTSNVTDMSSMFQVCSGLKSLDVSGFNTENVTDMRLMFFGCEGLTTLDVSGFNTSKVTDMIGMFNGCSGLTSLDVSGFNTSKVTDMNAMFSGCEGLKSLDVSGFNTSNVTDMSQMFNSCSSLTSIDVGGFNTSKVTDMVHMFNRCSSLKTIYVGEGWSTDNISSEGGINIFRECTSLIGGAGTRYDENHIDYTYAHIDGGTSNPGYLTDSSSDRPYAVLSDNNTMLTFYYDNQETARDGMSVGPFKNFSERGWDQGDPNGTIRGIERVVFDESFANCTTITSTSYWFHGLINLTTIIDLNNLKTDNVTDMSDMFSDCSSLTTLDVSGFNTENVTDMTDMFLNCNSLKSLDVSGFNTSNVTDMSGMFYECSSLTSLDVSGFNTENVTNMHSMFSSCSGLTSLDVSGFNTSKVTDMNAMFSGCEGLKSLDVSGFDTSNVNNMAGMFTSCSGLTSLDLSGFNTSNVTDMGMMFYSCKSLTSLDLSGFNTENVTNMSLMFSYCSSLTSLDLSGFNTSNVTEMAAMFSSCSSLTTIYVGERWSTENITSEGVVGMFFGCTSLVGGAGTTYDENHTDHTYAHIDGGTSNPGYLTGINGGGEASEEAWNELHEAVDRGDKLLTEAREAGTVEQWALEELENMTVKGSLMYEEHTAGEEEVRHMTEELRHIINEVEEMMRQQPQEEALFDGLTAWVSGNHTLDDAFESVGGRTEAAKTIAAIVWDADDALTADMLDGITNPNLLVFVTEASKAPAGVQNVVINGVAEEIILTDATGNNNFYCPQSFTARSISYSRDFSQTTEIEVCRGWETIALPFDVQNITHESHGALVPFAGGNSGYHFWLRQLSENGLMSAAQIEANKPYLISMPNNSIYPSVYNQNGKVTFSASDATVPETTPQSDSYAGVTLYATFQQVAQGSSVYALNVGEARGEYPEGSVFEQSYRDIRPFQAYTTHTAGTRGIITLESLGGNDNTTGIEEIRMNSELRDSKGPWYSLDGRRLDAEPTKKGIYVKDGRKIVIK